MTHGSYPLYLLTLARSAKAEIAPLIDQPSPIVDDNVSPEARSRVGAEAETTHSSIDSNIDLAIDAINVVTGGDIGVSTGSNAHSGEGPTSDRPLVLEALWMMSSKFSQTLPSSKSLPMRVVNGRLRSRMEDWPTSPTELSLAAVAISLAGIRGVRLLSTRRLPWLR
jgi:hypothetical protein